MPFNLEFKPFHWYGILSTLVSFNNKSLVSTPSIIPAGLNAFASQKLSIIFAPKLATNKSLASFIGNLAMYAFLTGKMFAHSIDAFVPASSLSNISIIFSNLLNHSNSLLIYFLAELAPDGTDTTGYL